MITIRSRILAASAFFTATALFAQSNNLSDAQAHWGPPSEGFQLSVRLKQNTFTNGEAIMVSILLSNATDKPLMYYASPGADRETSLTVTREGQPLVPTNTIGSATTFEQRLRNVPRGSTRYFQLPVGAQREFQIDLGKVFDLAANGEYTVEAKRKVPKLGRDAKAEVVSGTAAFSIHPGKP